MSGSGGTAPHVARWTPWSSAAWPPGRVPPGPRRAVPRPAPARWYLRVHLLREPSGAAARPPGWGASGLAVVGLAFLLWALARPGPAPRRGRAGERPLGNEGYFTGTHARVRTGIRPWVIGSSRSRCFWRGRSSAFVGALWGLVVHRRLRVTGLAPCRAPARASRASCPRSAATPVARPSLRPARTRQGRKGPAMFAGPGSTRVAPCLRGGLPPTPRTRARLPRLRSRAPRGGTRARMRAGVRHRVLGRPVPLSVGLVSTCISSSRRSLSGAM